MTETSKWTVKLDARKFGPWAVVTGASSGIGKELARQVAASGINVVLVSRREAVLEHVGQALKERYGIRYRVIEADLSTEDGQRRVVELTEDLDVGLLVSNAGAGQPGNFLAFEESDLRMIAQLNAVSYMVLTHQFGRRLAKRGRGGVLLVSALGSETGIPFNAKEAASKGLVTTLGKSLHYEFNKLGLNISVLVVSPTETPIIEKMGLRRKDMPTKPMPVERTAGAGLAGLQANKMMVLPGLMFQIANLLVPPGLVRLMTANLMLKSTTFVA
jgi:short-subunit dehydrogenase